MAGFVAFAAAALAPVPPAVSAPARTPVAPQAAVLEVAGIGFAGRARLGAWTPVSIDVAAVESDIDGTLVIEAPAMSGEPILRFAAPVRAAVGATVRVFIPAIFSDLRAPGVVHLDVARGRAATLPLPRLRPIEELVVVLSAEPLGLEAAAAKVGRLDIAYVSPEALPPVWQAYEAVRLVVVRDLDDRRIDDTQRQAIRNWVWAGGRMLVMPTGDDTRHFQGPTLKPLMTGTAGGRRGRGQVIRWDRDAADPETRGDSRAQPMWEAALAATPASFPTGLEGTIAAGRPVPPRIHLIVGLLVIVYVVAVRRLARVLAQMRPASLLAAALFIGAATLATAQVAAFARGEASGVVSSIVVESIPGTGHGLLHVFARTVSSHGGPFELTAPDGLLLRTLPAAPVTMVRGAGVSIRGEGTGIQVAGAAVVPAAVSGTIVERPGGATVQVINRSGWPLEKAWVQRAGQLQSVPPIGEVARLVLDDQQWQAPDRLGRTEPNHALLFWAFSRLDADAILKATPAWLVGWWRDPALAMRWDGRLESPLQLVLVPLTAPP